MANIPVFHTGADGSKPSRGTMNICTECGNNFTPKKNKFAVYCSQDCLRRAHKNRLEPKYCKNKLCGKEFKPNDKRQSFCSKSCSATHHNPRTKRKPRETTVCLFCSNKLLKHQNKFCGHDCRVNYQSFVRHDDWMNGYTNASDATGELKAWARAILLEMCDYTCKCGWNKVNPTVGKPILTIDHVDGDWSNNYCWNLEVLCYNCHTLTPTFGSLNRGSKSGRRGYTITRDVRIV